jgi:hypothetical protein
LRNFNRLDHGHPRKEVRKKKSWQTQTSTTIESGITYKNAYIPIRASEVRRYTREREATKRKVLAFSTFPTPSAGYAKIPTGQRYFLCAVNWR